ncbi:MIT domain protein [Ancylostoma duodenale]|uniref:MIT domain protein n=1 Tax=Ancylostoma duodenale TaxID=51022 RepID=A0A0C2H0P0_9BILA|nr:MIT domain protein [Ancylostoma duodenale]
MSHDDAATASALQLAQRAIAFDQAQRYEEAIYCYGEAADRIMRLLQAKKMSPNFRKNAMEYVERAEFLKSDLPRLLELSRVIICVSFRLGYWIGTTFFHFQATKHPSRLLLEKVEFLLLKAQLLDEAGHYSLAIDLYSEATQSCIEAVSNFFSFEHLSPFGSSFVHRASGLTKEELAVLAITSNINGRKYVPFLSVDLKEKFNYTLPFTDKDGKLSLTEKQKRRIKAWLRPHEIFEEPKVIGNVDSGTIKQTVISDCSFVASLSITARYEKRFGKQIITSIIFPQNKAGQPVYNPSGKYMVKFHINGVWRKVIIDDYLPTGENLELLCSHSQEKGELWVSLLEKAYLKVMGGYDFPGSNSNIDLHALTGWIPDRIAIKTDSPNFNGNKGKRLLMIKNPWTHLRWKGRYSENDSVSWTPALCRALDYDPSQAKVKDDGMFKPNVLFPPINNVVSTILGVFWIDFESVCHFFDVFYVNWNPALFPFTYGIHALVYYTLFGGIAVPLFCSVRLKNVAFFGFVVFKFSLENVRWYIFHIYWLHLLCIFTSKKGFCSTWDSCAGPVKDLYSVADNPQYCLEVHNRTTSAVWILLTRHITDITDFAENKEYITVMVYKSGKKIYIPIDPKPLYEGMRINSPHYLCQMVVSEPGPQKYTLVVAQYEKMNTIYYTLRVYSSCQFNLSPIKCPYTVKKTETGKWEGRSAGGCGNGSSRETYKLVINLFLLRNNPLFHISLEESSDENLILVDLKGPKQYSVGFEIQQVSSPRTKPFERTDSGVYRPGYTVLALERVPAGVYSIRPMTFLAGQEGPFILKVEASCGFSMKRVQ